MAVLITHVLMVDPVYVVSTVTPATALMDTLVITARVVGSLYIKKCIRLRACHSNTKKHENCIQPAIVVCIL